MRQPQSNSSPQKRLFHTYLVLSLVLTLIVTAASYAAYRSKVFRRADLVLYDRHLCWKPAEPSSGKVALVLMDQESAERLGRKKSTWSRRHMAAALGNLCKAGAEVIGLDVVFFAPGVDPEEDRVLAGAMDRCGNIVLARFVAVEGRGEVAPLPVFQEAMIGDGFINMVPDRDGVLRKIPFLSIKPVEEGLSVSPSFSLEMVRAFKNLDFAFEFPPGKHFFLGGGQDERLELPYPDLRIHYTGREEVFTRVSFADAVENRFSPDAVQGKIVLIGSALATDKDAFATPFSGTSGLEEQFGETFGDVLTGNLGQKTVGVACHAHAIETILKESYIDTAGTWVVLLLVIVSGTMGLVFYPQRPGAFWGLGILCLFSAVILLVAHWAFSRHLVWVEVSPALAVVGIQYILGIGVQRAYSRRRTQVVTGLFGKYVSRGVVEDLLRGNIDESLEGRSVEVTVLFTDLRSFTSISESLTPRETGQLLNTYFDAMIPAVFRHGGTLDKLIGDAVMAFFGAPGEQPDHPTQGVLTALDMVKALERLRQEGEVKGVERLAMGVGLNTGRVTAGNLGSQTFMDYTVIGDTVNLASRLEGLNKHYGTTVLLSGETARCLDDRFLVRALDLVRVKGKEKPVSLFELMGLKGDSVDGLEDFIRVFEDGLRSYRSQEWDAADARFQEALRMRPEDGPARLYLERVCRNREVPPPPEWDGVTVFQSK